MDLDSSVPAGRQARGTRAEQDVLLAARSTLDALSISIDRIRELITRLNAMLDEGMLQPGPERRTHISYGGGPSPLVRDLPHPPATSAPAAVDEEPGQPAAPERQAPVSTRELIVVSELAQAGYSRQEIAERLRAQWGEQAAAVLREALD